MNGGLRKRRLPDAKLPRETVADTSISFRALGALLWVMSKPDGWTIRADQMAKDGKRPDGTGPGGKPHRREGREAIRTALLEELAAAGYYRLERRRMRDGRVLMGTAASEDPVSSWAEQHAIFGRNPVPVIEQADGTFLVQYPDGQLVPDDIDPPGLDEPPADRPGENAEDIDDVVPEETAGQAGAQEPVSGEPAPRNPAPVNPATGEAATGNLSPLEKEHVKGLSKDSPLSLGDQVTEGPALGADEERDQNSCENRGRLTRVVDWFARRRPDWKPDAIRAALATAVEMSLGTLDECATALKVLAEGPAEETWSPARLHSRADGPWWSGVHTQRAREAAERRRTAPRCRKPAHDHQPADSCTHCAGDALARDEAPQVDEVTARRGEEFLRHVQQRRRNGRPTADRAVAS